MKEMPIAIVGDFKSSNRSHLATNSAIGHSAAALGFSAEPHWIGTEEFERAETVAQLTEFGGVWVAPSSPYRSMGGALAAIHRVRENRVPLLGTCGGFQHLVLEYARNVLGFPDAEHEEIEPNASRPFISRLACSLVGRTMKITLQPDSLVARAYGKTHVQEQYHCNFGVNPAYVEVFRSSALRIVGSDDEGVVRAVELTEHPFFVGTLFLPQHNSAPNSPHPLISAFLSACRHGRSPSRLSDEYLA